MSKAKYNVKKANQIALSHKGTGVKVVGGQYKVCGEMGTLDNQCQFDNMVFELYSLKKGRGIVRVFDIEEQELIDLRLCPTIAQAENYWAKLLRAQW